MRRVAAFALFVVMPILGLPGTGGAAKQVDSLDASKTDVEVFMQVGAARRKVHAVNQAIRSSPEVSRYAHRDKQAALREFQKIFHGASNLFEGTRASDLSESFRVELRHEHDAKEFAREMRRRAGVDSAVLAQPPSESELLITIRRCQETGDADLEIFLRPDAAQADVDAVVAAVATQPNLSVIRVLSHDDAYDAFRTIFASEPALADSIRPADLARSVRVHATGKVSASEIRTLRGMPRVDTVESTPEVCTSIARRLAHGISPEGLAKLLHERTAGTSS